MMLTIGLIGNLQTVRKWRSRFFIKY